MQTFQLTPFPAVDLPPVQVTGQAGRSGNRLRLHYAVTGASDSLQLPPVLAAPRRRHDLWRTTCFEFFLAVPGGPAYWEFNLSPSGDWNVYAMDGYRQVNMREEPRLAALPFRFQAASQALSLDVTVALSPLGLAEGPLQMGVTTILQTHDGYESYWALVHPGLQADFHLRESFRLTL